MLSLLLNPLIRNIVIASGLMLALIIGYATWSAHLREIGAERERVQAEERAIAHQRKVVSDANKIDQNVHQDNQIVKDLLKEWGVKNEK